MNNRPSRRLFRTALAVFLAIVATCIGTASPRAYAQSVAEKQTISRVQGALERLPNYGVFDFLAFSLDRGTVTLMGYAYRGNLKSDAGRAVKSVSGVDDVVNQIEILPPSLNDDRIRSATFYNIYTDDFLSRYAPGGAVAARDAALEFARSPGMQPLGTYPIHTIVKNGRTMLLGIVDNEADKTVAGVRAREVGGVLDVQNGLVASRK